jgi:hypothetical protein
LNRFISGETGFEPNLFLATESPITPPSGREQTHFVLALHFSKERSPGNRVELITFQPMATELQK